MDSWNSILNYRLGKGFIRYRPSLCGTWMSEDKVSILISKELYDKAKKYIEEHGGFSSVEELVEFVLSEVLTEEEPESVYSKEEEEKIKERLRALGYL